MGNSREVSLFRARIKIHRPINLVDVLLLVGIFAFIYALIGVAQEWSSPYRPKTEINLDFFSLLHYSFLSLVRVSMGYVLSLIFTLTYGYVAAKSRVAEPILISLLDILQSVPVLGFMPGLVLALVGLFPRSNFGLELAAIIMIFTGQGWNMVFSYYSSLKGVPGELRDMTRLYRLPQLEVITKIELPFAANGLLWNSMVSMAGGWFFLMVIESFSLGDQDFRLPGIGSYMAVAYEKGDTGAVVAGIFVMFAMIIAIDRFIFAPLVAWSERFKFDSKGPTQRSLVLDWLNRSQLMEAYLNQLEKLKKEMSRRRDERLREKRPKIVTRAKLGPYLQGMRLVFIFIGGLVLGWGFKSMYGLVAATHGETWLLHLRDTFFTFLRVTAAVAIGAVWTVPLGVFIGTHPRWSVYFQPVVQIVASFPAPMLFPVIVGALLWLGVSLEFGAVVLMLFASQWYILFNVISGASLIPVTMIDLALLFNVRGWHYWKAIILPAIFPSLLNGLITAAGGAWNASIVAEFVLYEKNQLVATGIGASITRAAQAGDFPALAGGILMMVVTVVLLNRLVWGSLYKLAETRFRLE